METKRTEKRTETHACDLIDRQVAIDAVNELIRLLELPFAELKTGRWIHVGYDQPHGVDWMYCSECGKRDVFCPNTMTNFCPNCGAKMEV